MIRALREFITARYSYSTLNIQHAMFKDHIGTYVLDVGIQVEMQRFRNKFINLLNRFRIQ